MRTLTERSEIAGTINLKKMPVVHFDLAEADEYGLVSKPVSIATNRGYFLKAVIRAYKDSTKFEFHQGAICLSDRFTYSDFMEIMDYANAPVIRGDEDVCIVFTDSEKKECFTTIVLHTGKRVDILCSSPLFFEDQDYDTKEFLELAGIKQELRN